MIVLFTDFGPGDLYVGQVHAVLLRDAPGVPIVDLCHAVPNFDIQAAAYLLPAYVNGFPEGSVLLCVIDPGVGTQRRPLMLEADGRWYVGPDNGLFHIVARRAQRVCAYLITWRPAHLTPSFHGRDLFAPVAAALARGERPPCKPVELTVPSGEWPDDLARIVYIDHYGNAISGLRASSVSEESIIAIRRHRLMFAPVFAEAPPEQGFWYRNANGLVEIAVNQGSAQGVLELAVGDRIKVLPSPRDS